MKQLSIIPDDGFVIVARERSQQKSEHIGIDNAGCVTLSRQVAKGSGRCRSCLYSTAVLQIFAFSPHRKVQTPPLSFRRAEENQT